MPSFRAFVKRPQSPAPNPNSNPGSVPLSQDPSRVRSRLHALFTPGHNSEDGQPEAGPSTSPSHHQYDLTELQEGFLAVPSLHGGVNVARAVTEPVFGVNHEGAVESIVIPQPDREAIKVLIVTWNMGDALPKGDLSVLLGQIPPYQPPSPCPGIPQLPVENLHPYHIVVVAGQECPTPSGAPRGLGGGLMKGVTLRHKREAREKEKEKEKDKGNSLDTTDKASEESRHLRSPVPGSDEGGEDEHDLRTSATSPMTPHTPFMHRPPPATKGWSQMLDEYFCGPGHRHDGIFPSVTPSPRDSPSPNPTHTGGLATSQPILIRSASAPITPTTPIPIPNSASQMNSHTNHHHHLQPHLLSPSPLARSRSSFESTSSSSSGEAENSFINMPTHHNDFLKPSSAPSKIKTERPEIVVPVDEPPKTAGGTGSYIHVVKERLLGMYLSVYVYKGCEHLIQGLDKDFVTAGLAGGRVGNKGGIGISLKLADHRFLFVNSHLAAHASRQAARLANIAKIKHELRLDCFLPKEDPRAALPDITDRFDTVFWCGDLNFRLELSRLHADWLIEQKKYAEALMWDQLKMAMQNPETNPFPGFEEGEINFPCTFKYDVWKSVRATNRELRRTMKRRKSSASAASVDLEVVSGMAAQSNLSGVPEGDAIEEVDDAERDGNVTDGPGEPRRDSDDDEMETGMSRRSFDSSRYTSAAPSTIGTDIDDDSDEIPAFGQHTRHRPFEVALKEKTRHLLGLVKMDGILTPSPRRGQLGRRVSRAKRKVSLRRRKAEQEEDDFDATSRRTSMSSIASRDHPPRPSTPEEETRISSSAPARSETAVTSSLAVPVPARSTAMESDLSMCSASPPRDKVEKAPKKLSIMRRTMSGISVKEGIEEEDEEGGEAEEDHREGVYDTSKKQRVPSWCDRVLWKAHIEEDPDPETDISADQLDVPSLDREKPFHRLSNAFANFGGHFRSIHMGRTPSMDVSPQDRVRLGPAIATGADVPEISESNFGVDRSLSSTGITLVASPPGSPSLGANGEADDLGTPGLIPAPRKASPARSPFQPRGAFPIMASQSSPLSRPPSPTKIKGPTPLRSDDEKYPSPPSSRISQTTPEPRRSKMTLESPSSLTMDKLQVTLLHPRPRSNSDTVVGAAQPSETDPAGGGVDGTSTPKKGRVSDGYVPRTSGRGIPHANTLAVPPHSERSRTKSHDHRATTISIDHISQTPNPEQEPRPLGAALPARTLQPTAGPSRRNSPEKLSPPRLDHNTSSTSAATQVSGTGTLRERENDKNAFVRFLRDLPGWLHVRSSVVAGERSSALDDAIPERPRRHRKGEVVCLHYGTIDDAGMRQLEGRSDHRPAIFSAAVYI